MTNLVQSISLDRLLPHPDNPNKISRANFAKLVRNIEQTGRYEPLVVRPCPDKSKTVTPAEAGVQKDCFQIINGHHRLMALAKLGYKAADAIVWNIDDEQTDILLATLNRLGGSDELAKKLKLLKRLNKKLEAAELSKLLPQTAKQIERLTNLKRPTRPAISAAKCFANPLVFFLNDKQQQIVENALSLVDENKFVIPAKAGTKAAKRAAALTHIAQYFLNNSKKYGQNNRTNHIPQSND